jgi:hypothetical protein
MGTEEGHVFSFKAFPSQEDSESSAFLKGFRVSFSVASFFKKERKTN